MTEKMRTPIDVIGDLITTLEILNEDFLFDERQKEYPRPWEEEFSSEEELLTHYAGLFYEMAIAQIDLNYCSYKDLEDFITNPYKYLEEFQIIISHLESDQYTYNQKCAIVLSVCEYLTTDYDVLDQYLYKTFLDLELNDATRAYKMYLAYAISQRVTSEKLDTLVPLLTNTYHGDSRFLLLDGLRRHNTETNAISIGNQILWEIAEFKPYVPFISFSDEELEMYLVRH